MRASSRIERLAGLLRMGGRGWEAVVMGQRYERGTVTWVAVPPWLHSSNLALPIFAKLGQGTRSSPRSKTNPPAVNIKHAPSHSNGRAVSSSGAPVVSSQSTAPYSGAEQSIYSHACPSPFAPSTAGRPGGSPCGRDKAFSSQISIEAILHLDLRKTGSWSTLSTVVVPRGRTRVRILTVRAMVSR